MNQALESTVAGEGDYVSEFRVYWPNEELHWVAGYGRLVEQPPRGKVVIGVNRDITDQKEREQRLESQARLLDLAHEPILVRDSQDAITYWNSGAERLYGYTRLEALGQSSHLLLKTQFPERLSAIVSRMHETGRWEGELIHTTRNGHAIHVASRWQEFESFGSLVLETDFDLSHYDALQVARVWQEKAKLIGELSHQINNPLEAATGAAHMLKQGCEQPVQQYLEILETSIQRIAEFIRKTNELHQSARTDILWERLHFRSNLQ